LKKHFLRRLMMERNRISNFYLIIALLILFSGCSGSSSDDDNPGPDAEEAVLENAFLAGANVAELVPENSPKWWEEYKIYLAGYGMLGIRGSGLGKAQGVNDPPYVRSMVITQGTEFIAIAVIDACVIGNRIIKEIQEKVSEKTEIPRLNVYIAATHSHASLDLLGAYGGVSDEYRAFVIDKIVKSIVDADSMKVPAKLFVSAVEYKPSRVTGMKGEVFEYRGKPVNWVCNRRGWPDVDRQYSEPDADNTINIIEARDYSTDRTIGVMVNYGSHPVIVSPDTYNFTRDYCGYLIDYIQRKVGAPSIYIQGTMGDVNPIEGNHIGLNADNSYFFAKQFGEDVAKQALAGMSDQKMISPGMHVSQARVESFSIDNPLMLLLFTLLSRSLEMDVEGSVLKGLKADTQVTYIKLGEELQISMLPGEALTHMGLGIREGEHFVNGQPVPHFKGIKEAMTAPFKMVTSLTGDELIYLVPSQEWNYHPGLVKGDTSYEESMSMSLDGILADACREKAIRLIDADR
jgi:hypothetical protein